ncbi:MAG TPA: hypothetical protein VEI26_05055, partial [Terriglobales bacterium]|nr:hypothetical protein [Terriglobales bacterium]
SAKASPEGEMRVLELEASHAAALGQLTHERERQAKAVERAKSLGIADVAADHLMDEAETEAAFGYSPKVADQLDAALALSRDPSFVARTADIYAAVGQDQKAESLIAEARRARPEDTFIQNVLAPAVEARLQLRRGKAAAAVQTLAVAQPYDDGQYLAMHVLLGEAYLASGEPANAVQEFRKYLIRRWQQPFSFHYPLAQLGLARALAAQHDTADARTAYQDLFAMWKDADPDLLPLKEAKTEYAKLQ